jgi:hypothetical protein
VLIVVCKVMVLFRFFGCVGIEVDLSATGKRGTYID